MISRREKDSLRDWLSIAAVAAVLAVFSLSVFAGEQQDRGLVVAPTAAVNAVTALGRGGSGADIDVRQAAEPLLAKAEQKGKVRVIIKVRLPEQTDLGRAMVDGVQEAGQRNGISRAQRDVLTRLGITPDADASGRPRVPVTLPDNIANLRLFRTVPYLSMFADASTLERLLADPQVVAVHEDVPVPPALKDSVPLINADDVWGKGSTGGGIAVAILDTGVDKSHAFFQSRVVSEACFSTTYAPYGSTSLCPGGVAESTAAGSGVDCSGAAGCGHGTHVAGIAAGANAIDGTDTYSGVAKGADIIAIQVFSRFTGTACSDSGLGDPCVLTYSTDQMAALDHIYDNLSGYQDIAAVNMSLGGGRYTEACDVDMRKAYIDNLRSAGITTVIAAGNSYYDDAVGAPGCISTAVTVAASNKNDSISVYTNWGALIDVVAPGTNIRSSQNGGGYVTMSGTSMAAPHVAGAFALLRQMYRTASVSDREAAMATSSITVSYNGVDKPRIDVVAALDYLAALYDGSLQVQIEPAEAVTDGAQWRRLGTSIWRNSGTTETDIPEGSYTLEFRTITGWTKPANQQVSVIAGTTNNVNETYTLNGALQVVLSPQGAIDAGAKWRRVGTSTWFDSGATEGNITPGNHTIEFKAVAGWNAPAQQSVVVTSGVTTVASASYTAVTSSSGGGGSFAWLALTLLAAPLLRRRLV